jgi:hypothetical protein
MFLLFNCISFVVDSPADKIEDSYIFLIITPSKFSSDLIPLKEHKESKSISTKIITLDEIYNGDYFPVNGRDDPEKIKYFIKNSLDNWSISYVMLVGNKDDLPARFVPIYQLTGNYTYYISDLYYADIYDQHDNFQSWDTNNDNIFAGKEKEGYTDDVDLYPDVFLGRILCSSNAEITTFVNKVINYENNAYGESWFKNFVTCGADDCRGIFMEAILPFLLKRIGRIVFEGEYMGDRVANILSDFTTKKIYGTGLFRLNAKFLTNNNINNAINEGAGFLMFIGHGKPHIAISTQFPLCKNVWLPKPSPYSITEVQTLSNGEKLPVAMFGGCSCGDFDTLNSPVAWAFIKNPNGGAIASLAATSGTSFILGSLCTETYHGHMILSIFRSYKSGTDIIGDIWSDTITNFLDDEDALKLGDDFSLFNWHSTLENHRVIEEWTLFGDPTLKIGGYA